MGYVNDKAFAQFIPPGCIAKSAGTWTATLASNVYSEVRTAAAAGFNLFVPLMMPSNADALKGAKLLSVELVYKVATAALTSVTTVELEKDTISAAGAVTGAAVTATINGTEDTSAKRLAQGDHRVIVTPTVPKFLDNDEYQYLYVTFVAQATTAFTLFGAIANYELRA